MARKRKNTFKVLLWVRKSDLNSGIMILLANDSDKEIAHFKFNRITEVSDKLYRLVKKASK